NRNRKRKRTDALRLSNASRSHNKLRTRSPFSAEFGASFETSGLNSGRKFSPVSQVHGYAWG
ncbi:hypothetical protein LWV15_22485, partial [Enterobacter hormaechei]|nr:hypothetical protein [Enterobacter hormaechei]